MKYFNTNESVLKMGKINVVRLVEEYDTPLYVYDTDIIKKQYQSLKDHLSDRVKIFFAMKSNPNIMVCSFLRSLGASVEVASSGELFAAIKSGFNKENIIFDGPGKSCKDLEFAIKTGIYIINVESIEEIKRINTIAKKESKRTKVCIRINPRVGVEKAKMKWGGGPHKFGVDEEKADDVIKYTLDAEFVELLGIHVSVGSQIADHKGLLKSTENTIQVACETFKKNDIPLRCINLGGGIGVPYDENDVEVDIEAFGKGLVNIIKEKSKEYGLEETEFILEPGRYLTSESGVYLVKVIDIKESGGKKFAIVDGGINHSFLPITMNKKYPTFVVNKMDMIKDEAITIGGPLCTSMDIFSREVDLPKVEIGDIIGIFNSGAYGFSASMLYFLSHPLPAEIVIRNGRPFIARERGKVEDFLINQRYENC